MGVQSIQIKSNNLCYGTVPAPDEEVEQHLTINKSGRVWFSALDFEHFASGKTYCRREQIGMGVGAAKYLLNLLDKLEETPMVTDCGTYSLEIRYEDAKKRMIYGALIGDANVTVDDVPVSLTKLIRRLVPIDRLFAFDGNMEEDYAGYEAIASFVSEWEEKFRAKKLSDRELEEAFGKGCAVLGFRRDAADWVSECYPGCMAIKGGYLDATAGKIRDVDMLGAAVYSQWRYLTHWEGRYELDHDTCHWFTVALRRMKELAEQAAEKNL